MVRSRQLTVLLLGCLTVAIVWMPAGSQAQEPQPLTIQRILELLKGGTPSEEVLKDVRAQGGEYELTLDQVVELRAAGASPELIRRLAQGAPAPEPVESRPLAEAVEPLEGALAIDDVVRMHKQSIPPDQIAAAIASKGLRQAPTLEELLALSEQGVPEAVLRVLAGGAAPPPPSPSAPAVIATGPLAPADVVGMLEAGEPAETIVADIKTRGVTAAPTLAEVLALRQAGADEAVLAALNEAAPREPAPAGAQPEVAEEDSLEPWQREDAEETGGEEVAEVVPPAPGEDVLRVFSTPPGARVYVAASRTRLNEAFRHDYLAGKAPVTLTLPPGEYRVIVQKPAGRFEREIVPAWRTSLDRATTRSLLDNADLTFDPTRCCLPGSLTGTVEVRAVTADLPHSILGDRFEGLSPYLFDGETLQILSVREGAITQAMKVYSVRKNPGQPRMLIATFLPAEGDPLDPSEMEGLPKGAPFDAYMQTQALEILAQPSEIPAVASALGVPADLLAEAVPMLRRTGKAILHLKSDSGVRVMAIALDEDGRLRLYDQTLRPEDPFAPPTPPPKRKKKPVPPPTPPPIPQPAREVVPGLGMPRLVLENQSSRGVGLLLSEGLFCFVPAKTHREFVVDPGTHQARLLGAATEGPHAEGSLHFSYHARYTLTF